MKYAMTIAAVLFAPALAVAQPAHLSDAQMDRVTAGDFASFSETLGSLMTRASAFGDVVSATGSITLLPTGNYQLTSSSSSSSSSP